MDSDSSEVFARMANATALTQSGSSSFCDTSKCFSRTLGDRSTANNSSAPSLFNSLFDRLSSWSVVLACNATPIFSTYLQWIYKSCVTLVEINWNKKCGNMFVCVRCTETESKHFVRMSMFMTNSIKMSTVTNLLCSDRSDLPTDLVFGVFCYILKSPTMRPIHLSCLYSEIKY